MNRAAVSVFVFSIYLVMMGLVLVAMPNVLLSIFRVPETNEVWIRVVGMLALILALYYATAARNNLTAFFRASVYGRISVLLFFIAFVAFGFAPTTLILFGLIDAAAAVWTALSLRTDQRA